ncbi:deaminase, partial [Ruminiclostridium cellobioparum]|uniref:deaminase n=1 Tax=Ruminiclostridium cellobioparum TaxID=29355 RepID=UPI001FA6FF20
QGIMKPLEGPVKTVGGMIDQVTDQTTGMVDSAEKTTLSSMGSGAKLMTAMGIGGQSKNESKAGGKETGQAQGGSKAEGGGDIFGTVRSGIHNNLMTLGLINLKKLGMQILAAGAAKISGAIRKMLTPKVKFKLGSETHELWVEQDKTRNSVMMASTKGTEVEENSKASRILAESGELRDKLEKTKKKQNESQANANLQDLAQGIQAAGQGESKAANNGPWEEIDRFRSKTKGLEPLGDRIPERSDGLGTVAYVELNGTKVFGVNSSVLSDESKDLGREFLKSMQAKGFLNEVKSYGQGHSQVLTHAEGHALMRAWKKTGGNLGSNVVIYVDRLTCGICQENLPKVKEFMNIKTLQVICKNGTKFTF